MDKTEQCPIIITPGDPAGIGAELSLKAAASGVNDFIIIENAERLRGLATALQIDLDINAIAHPSAFTPESSALQVIDIEWAEAPVPGQPSAKNAAQIIDGIRTAVNWTRDGICAAVTTNPIAKAPLLDAGFTHPGHTEFLGTFGPKRPGAPMMMLACDALRVVPLTVHIPLTDVANNITTDSIIEACQLLATDLTTYFGVVAPRIAVCGLNPHAGEDGKMGHEDIEIIAPAVTALQAMGITATGPHPSDSLFHADARKTYDAVLGMYHDQALIPLKTIDFFGGVNVTLGLDFIRTSPDHGTGFDIAGRGVARPDSLIAALKMARQMAEAKKEQS